jgi:hypothetical protein
MSRFTAVLTLLILLVSLSIGELAAQSSQDSPVSFTVDGAAVHQASSDLKDGGGDFDLDRWFLSAGINYSWNPRNSIGFTVGGGKSSYHFDPESGFGAGDPWDKVNDLRFSVPMRFKVSEKATAIVIPSVRFNGESGADTSDSRTWGLLAAVAWRLSSELTIGPGIGVFSKLDDGNRIFPVLAIDWDINERWNLGTGAGLAASQGPGLTLSYKVSEHWKIALSGRYEDLEFRLDEDGPAPAGIGRDQSFPLVLSAQVQPNPKITMSLFAGLEFGGKLKLKDSLGDLVAESSYDPAPLIGVRFAARF